MWVKEAIDVMPRHRARHMFFFGSCMVTARHDTGKEVLPVAARHEDLGMFGCASEDSEQNIWGLHMVVTSR